MEDWVKQQGERGPTRLLTRATLCPALSTGMAGEILRALRREVDLLQIRESELVVIH